MQDLVYEKFPDRHFCILRLNRPERLNALGRQLTAELQEATDDFHADAAMRVAILTGTGRAFSAGWDLKEVAERDSRWKEIEARFGRGEITSEQRTTERAAAEGVTALRRTEPSNKPIIAAINGLCLAGGMERTMACDIRICSTEAYFGVFEVKRGLVAPTSVQHLARLIPYGEAMYLILTGDRLSAEQAHRIGFVHEVLPPEQLLPRAIAIAEQIAANAPLAVQLSRAVAQHWRELGLAESQKLFNVAQQIILASEDAKEGPRAFAEKREPLWQGR